MAAPAKAIGVVAEARARLKLAKDADGGNREAALEDLKFASGDQWPAEIEMARKLDRRPCLTINKVDTFIRSTVNNMRQQRPRIQVHPVSDGSDEQTAKVIQGLIKHIEVNSNADHAYDTAADFQVRMGWGYIRLATRYVDDKSFDQEIYIDAVKNPFTVYLDPSSTAPDGSDAQWAIITERMKIATFKQHWPKAKVVSIGQLGNGDDLAEWANNEEIVVADYYRITETPDRLHMLSDGTTHFESDMPPVDVLEFAGLTIAATRPSIRRSVKVSKITAVEELEVKDLPGKHIPVVPVYGAELLDNGKTIRYGMTRQLKDPQRMYNFWRTSETEIVALAPKAPWLMAEGQDEGREQEWNNANSKNYSSLKYKVVEGANGEPLPPPMRQQPQAIPAASVQAAMGASEDMKAVAGMFDPALGAEGNETSGTMVQQRQQQSDMSNFHFYDNLTRSVRWVGKLILEWIPTYYDTQRVLRIIGEDSKPEMVTINERSDDAVGKVLNDVTTGLYDVVMETGPGYQTKRQEEFAFFTEMLKVMPHLGEVAGDLIVRMSDNPGAGEIADRMAAVNPLSQMDKDLPKDIDPKVKAMLMQLQGQLQQAQKKVQQLSMEKQAHVFGVQAKGQVDMQRDVQEHRLGMERMSAEERHETHRLTLKELGEDERTRMEIAARLQERRMQDQTSMAETLVDARTNLEIAHKQALQRGNPDSNRTTR